MIFPYQAQGSLIEKDGKVIGSALIGQAFADDKYFHGRPSATNAPTRRIPAKTVDAPYNAANSVGSNLGPTSKALAERVKGDVETLKKENPSAAGPGRSGDDIGQRARPDISPEAALFQVPRVAKARGLPEGACAHAGRKSDRGPDASACSANRVSTCSSSISRSTT